MAIIGDADYPMTPGSSTRHMAPLPPLPIPALRGLGIDNERRLMTDNAKECICKVKPAHSSKKFNGVGTTMNK